MRHACVICGCRARNGSADARDNRGEKACQTNCPVPETKCSHATRQLAGYLTNLWNTRFARECVVADAVEIEPVSAAKFPAIREFAGNLLRFAGNLALRRIENARQI